jgi:hypothetical protein
MESRKFEYAVIQFGYTKRLVEEGAPFEGPLPELTDHRYVQVREVEELDPSVPAVPRPEVIPYDEDDSPLLHLNPKSFPGEEAYGSLPGPFYRDAQAEEVVRDIAELIGGTYGCAVLQTRYMSDVTLYCRQIERLGHCNLGTVADVQYGTTPGKRAVVYLCYDSESG